IDVKSMVAGDSIFVLLQPTLYQPDAPDIPGIKVQVDPDNASGAPNSAPPKPYYRTFFHPDGAHCYYPGGVCTGLKRELGAFAAFDPSHPHAAQDTVGGNNVEVESTYNFKILDVGATGSQGDVVLDAADPSPSATVINIQAYIDIHKRSG